jgi:carotenoid cleavage dioxygenase-like enzyme
MHYSVIDKHGKLVRTVGINLPSPIMAHDFAITQRYAILMDFPLQFQPKKMVREGSVFALNKTASSRIGLLPP